MGPIILAFLFGLLYLVQITIILNIFNIHKRAKFMLLLWFINLPLLTYCFLVADKYGLMDSVDSNRTVNLAVTMFFYTAGFFGGILQLYNLADRGFSLQILVDIYRNKDQLVTLDQVLDNYSDGKGIKWMYQKRINDMTNAGLISINQNNIYCTYKGYLLAKVFQSLRTLFNFHKVVKV